MARSTFYLIGVSVLGLIAITPTIGQEKKPFEPTKREKELFELTNLERKKKDLSLFTLNPALCKIARGHSENMARQRMMEHELDKKKSSDRMRDAGYQYAKAGENIGQSDAEVPLADLMKAWMESKYHRENILLPAFTEIGIGIARDKNGEVYYTQVFARPLAE